MIQKGILKGKKLGIDEGIQSATLALAKNLLAEGLELQLITRTTGLSLEELQKLRGEH